jgi:hypothetical protein
MAQSILVTGGAGYIGSHACKTLARAGFVPVTYDNLERGHAAAVKWGPLEQGDLQDRARLDAVIKKHRPAGVIHFAAYAYIGESVEKPDLYYRNNVSLIDALHAANVDCLVFSSTCAIYGAPETVPIPESQPCHPINPYGRSKLMIEQILDDYRRAYGFRSYALRYFNAAGADPDGEIGECHDPETHLIPLVLDAAAGLRPHISVFGNDYPTPAFATTSMSATWPKPMSRHCAIFLQVIPARASTWERAPAIRSRTSSRPRKRSPAARFRRLRHGDGPATPRPLSPIQRAYAKFSRGRRGAQALRRSSAMPGDGTKRSGR